MRHPADQAAGIRKNRLHQAAPPSCSVNGGLKAKPRWGDQGGAGGRTSICKRRSGLEGLITSCYYLTSSATVIFSLTPNVNKILTDRRAAVQQGIDERLGRDQ